MRPETKSLVNSTLSAAQRMPEFTCASLAEKTGVGVDTVRGWVKDWARHGKVSEVRREGNTRVYRAAVGNPPAQAPNAPTQSPEQNMWRAMRHLRGSFTPVDVASHACTDLVAVSAQDAHGYCQLLSKAGYLRVTRRGQPPAIHPAYQLIKNTGPRPPAAKRIRAVWDANLGKFTHLPGGAS